MGPNDTPMVRPWVPEAEKQIGVQHAVLGHGYVVLVDYMGNDAAVVQSARVSYGAGTKSVRDDRGLIRYLLRHRHTTPFEMVEFKFLVRLPIFVARQWIRHRTACLAEGTQIYFDHPKGVGRLGGRPRRVRVEELWRRFQPIRAIGSRARRDPYFGREEVRRMLVRQLDEDRGVIGNDHVVNVTRNGVKPVFRMRLGDGKSIDCTSDHRFLFSGGWSSLADQTGLREVDGRVAWDHGVHFLNVNGAERFRPELYRDGAWLEEMYVRQDRSIPDIAEACGVTPQVIRTWCRRLGLVRYGSPTASPPDREDPLRQSCESGRGPFSAPATVENDVGIDCFGTAGRTDRRPRAPMNRPSRRSSATFSAEPRATSSSGPGEGESIVVRESIGRWTARVAPSVHGLDQWTCQRCGRVQATVHAHHIVPVWVDLSRARDATNLTTQCDACDLEEHRNELIDLERLVGTAAAHTPASEDRMEALDGARLARVEDFEFLGDRMTYDIEVEGPSHNFIANGIVTHNSVNEYSARYSIVPDEYEVPPPEEIRQQSKRNRQGRGESLPTQAVERFRSDLERVSKEAYSVYTKALNDGVARETARLVLPVSYYTQWYWKIDLYNLMHFLSLRLDPHSQEEIRLYASEIAKLTRLVCPVAYEAFEDFALGSLSLSRREQHAVRELLAGATPEVACEKAGLPMKRDDGKSMTTGEGIEFLEKLERLRQTGP